MDLWASAPQCLTGMLFPPGCTSGISLTAASVTGAWAVLRSALPASESPQVANHKVYDALVTFNFSNLSNFGIRHKHVQPRLDLFAALRSMVPLIKNFGLQAGGWQTDRHPRLLET